eukprot:gi/632937354/ref/XP_007899330.1/ PREDICTED: palmitoyltransferase ZDHHC23 isoform X1 [Callorhinchus milii]
MKKKRSQRSDEDTTLCCCEYFNRNGERTHILASCCDCEDLDDACDRCLKGQSINPQSLERIADTISDRLRVPWLLGSGAKKIDITVLPPLILLPIFLHIAALHHILALIVLTIVPILVLWYYYITHHKKGQTLFFLSLGLFSLGYMYYLFLCEVFPKGDVSLVQLMVLTSGMVLTLVSLRQAKMDPGYLRADNGSTPIKDIHTHVTPDCSNGMHKIQQVGRNGSTKVHHLGHNGMQAGNGSLEKNWCNICKISRPPRSGHCRLCAACVQKLDHHCVWINSCVGETNHRAFILTLALFLLTSLYGISLTLNSICKGRSVFMALFYCPGVYNDHRGSSIWWPSISEER